VILGVDVGHSRKVESRKCIRICSATISVVLAVLVAVARAVAEPVLTLDRRSVQRAHRHETHSRVA
jgi:hypothetical protein